MTLERLSDYLGSSYKRGTLQKIYLARQIEQNIYQLTKQKVQVIIRPTGVLINCENQTIAYALEMKRTKISKILADHLPSRAAKFKVVTNSTG